MMRAVPPRSHILTKKQVRSTVVLYTKCTWALTCENFDQTKKNSRTPFWTLKDGFEPEVNEGSNMSLRQSQKWWKKVPEKYLAPEPKIWGTGGPMDPYDRPYTRKDPKEDNMAVKVTTETTSVADMDPKLRGPYIPRAAPKAEIRSSV